MKPAPEADRRTLARRASLDLTGLPPDPAAVEAFVADQSPDAYERYVDRLLESPAWGEHRGRYWLDAARYADTHGIHFDNFREMWTYRDWVISAFNANLPFDQFTIEQLAGDLLPSRTLDQQIGSGFNRCNMTTNEGGVIPEEYLVLYTRDRTETMSQVWLGMTAGCAVCHDHKFDPLTQREFYELAAFFNNTTQGAMDGNIKDTPPIVVVPTASRPPGVGATARQAGRRRSSRSTRGSPAAAATSTAGWPTAAQRRPARSSSARGCVFYAPLGDGSGNELAVSLAGEPRQVSAGSAPDVGRGRHRRPRPSKAGRETNVAVSEAGDFEKDQPFTCSAWVKVPRDNVSGAIVARMDDGHAHQGWDLWLDRGRPGSHIVHKWPDDAVKVIAKNPLKADKWQYVSLTYDGSGEAEGVKIYRRRRAAKSRSRPPTR